MSNLSSRALLHEVLASFRRHAEFPSESVAAPAFIPGVDWSDHWSFWKEGYPALMVTDTAPYRYPYYHTVQDTPDKVDYERAARVVTGLQRMLRELAGGADAPRQTLAQNKKKPSHGPRSWYQVENSPMRTIFRA